MTNSYGFKITGASCVKFADCSVETVFSGLELKAENFTELFENLLSVDGIPEVKYGDFKRGDDKVKAYLAAATAAFYDSGFPVNCKFGIIDWGTYGCHEQNKRYFAEYLENAGRGRGRSFVGTLQTTPACECAISLGLTGAIYYLDTCSKIIPLCEDAELLLEESQGGALVLFNFTPERVICLIVSEGKIQIEQDDTFDTIIAKNRQN